ncbi:MAG: 50S ribosomal protein L25 [Actinomycetia bacterium]|nr:50S ribosomal protein L25 [Actinomycetes bacterium]
MADVKLTVQTGRPHGSRSARRLRADEKVPGVVYGLGSEPLPVAVDRRDLRLALTTDAGLNALLDLDLDGSVEMAVVKDVQRHPVRREVTHVDFLRVDPDARIEVDVPIHTTGEASLVTAEEGIAELRLTSLLVSVKPTDIPEDIVVDISDMTMDKTITVADLDLPAEVDIVTPEDQVIVSAEITRAALVEEEPAEGEEGEEGEEGAEGAEGAEASEGGDDSASGGGDE